MKIRHIAILMLFCGSSFSMNAATRSQVEGGIATVERLVEGHQWQEAFTKLREVDASIGAGSPELHYLTMKQRYRMYFRINKSAEVRNCMTQMEVLANQSGNTATIEDMLITKAAYNNYIGNQKVSKDCYITILNRRTTGKDNDEKDKCFQKLIAEAKAAKNTMMKSTISELYTAWQDSISAVKAGKELKDLKASYEEAKSDIDSKQTKINMQWGVIIFLVILLIGVAAGLCFFIFVMIRNRITIKQLRNSLELSEKNSAQKSIFMRNITNQIAPSLTQIAQGNKIHVTALGNLLNDVETFIELDNSKEDKYELAESNVGSLCESIVSQYSSRNVTISTDAPKMSFPINKEAVTSLVCSIIDENLKEEQPEKILLGFKKRNPHTGQFTVTVVGKKYSDEEKETIFTAFAKIYDLTKTTGLVMPTSALMAHKMGGALSIDNSFAKGTRFVLEIHC